MASGLITPWQIEGEKVEAVTDFHFLGSKITVDGDYNHEVKALAPWKKSYDKLDSVLKAETLLRQQTSIQLKLWFFQ